MPQVQAPDINLGEILRQVAREKDIDLERWIAALEDAMASAAKKQHRIKEPVRAHFNRDSGRFEAFMVRRVVEEVLDPLAEWTVEEALEHRPEAAVGDEILTPVSTEGLGRIAAQSAKQVLYQRVREAEREKIYNEYKDRVGEIVNGTVKRFERGDIIVDLGRTEAIVRRDHQSRSERYSQGERIRAVVVNVHKEPKGPQIELSRTSELLLRKLFEMEVPEIYDGTVVIKNAVRSPGERAKVAVYSRERDVDPVGACVGMKGSRVQAIIRELRGEKIDIIEFSDDLVTYAQSALAPARITRVSVHHQGPTPHLDVIVEDDQLSLAIGKRGQNVRLASELISCRIDIKSEREVKDEVADALARLLQNELAPAPADEEVDFAALGVAGETAERLVAAGFGTVAALASGSPDDLAAIEGVDADRAEALLSWAAARREELEPQEAPHAVVADLVSAAGQTASSSMTDEDFMAALTKGMKELERQQAQREVEPGAEGAADSESPRNGG